MRDPVRVDGQGSGCPFDYSTPEAREAIRGTIESVLDIRRELHDPAEARSVGRDQRLYERSLGLAVAPMLVLRAASGLAGRWRSKPVPGQMPDLMLELRQELEHDSLSPKMMLYERSLGIAVIPVLLRNVYTSRRRARGAGLR
jgi:hypothetical protein